jgi:hypothetical protein
VLVPETLLKKRKSQEQARAVAREEAAKKKEVSIELFFRFPFPPSMMTTTTYATRLRSMLSLLLTIFRG